MELQDIMNISSNDKVNNYLTDMQLALPQQYDMVILIRATFNKSNKYLVEDIKYGGLILILKMPLLEGFTHTKSTSQ